MPTDGGRKNNLTTETVSHRQGEQTLEEMRAGRQYLKYTFFKLATTWWKLSIVERDSAKESFRRIFAKYSEKMIVKPFSLFGTRGDSDFMLWTISENLKDFQDLLAEIMRSPLGAYISLPYSYLSMTRRSEYI